MAWLDLFDDVDIEAMAHILRVTTQHERQLAADAFTGKSATKLARWCLWRIEHIIREVNHAS
jgi:hypothetical protein